MRSMLVGILLLGAFSTPAQAARYQEDSTGEAFTYTQIRALPGYGYASVLNQDGSRAIYGGPHIGGEFDIVFSFQDIGLAAGPFAHYQYSIYPNLRNTGTQSQELAKTEFLVGMKAFIGIFYAGFAYGENTSWFSNNMGTELKLQASVLGFTGGMKLFSISKSWQVGLTGWYKSTLFTKSRNTSLQDNTQMETLEGSITFTYTPLFQIL